MTVSILMLLFTLLAYSASYELPHFPDTAILTFNYHTVTPGQRLSESTTAHPPTINLPSAATLSLYTVVLIDPDAPSASSPSMAHWLHYLNSDVPGGLLHHYDFSALQPMPSATYAPPTPPPSTGPHRYVALVYKQSTELATNGGQMRVREADDQQRARWSLELWGGTHFVVENGVAGDEAGELDVKQEM